MPPEREVDVSTHETPRRPVAQAISAFGVFLATIAGTWCWFHVGVDSANEDSGVWITVRTNFTQFSWSPEPIGKDASDILDATILISGKLAPVETHLINPSSYLVFTADWLANAAKPLNVARHTPDVCWVGAGWRPAAVGIPRQIEIGIPIKSSTTRSQNSKQPEIIKLPFQCRTFRSPDSTRMELVVWCALLNGSPVAEGAQWGIENDSGVDASLRAAASSRRAAVSQFIQTLLRRIPGNRSKQFIRISRKVENEEADVALSQLSDIATEVFSAESVNVHHQPPLSSPVIQSPISQ